MAGALGGGLFRGHEGEGGTGLELMGFVDIVKRWWLTLVVSAIVGGVCGYFIASSIAPSYEASTEVLVGPFTADANTQKSAAGQASTFAEYLTTRTARDEAATEAGLTPGEFRGDVRAVADTVTRVLTVRVRSDDALETSEMANALVAHLGDRAGTQLPEGTLTVLEAAREPRNPVAPDVSLIVTLSTLAALVAAIGLILLVEYVGDTVKAPDELKELTGVSFVTSVGRFRKRSQPLLEVEARPTSAVSESLRLAATSADLLFVDRAFSMVVIGVDGAAGSAEIAANLAASLAVQGRRVTLVDATQEGAVTRLMDLDERPGLAKEDVGELALERVTLAGGVSLRLLRSGQIGALSQLGAEDAQELLDLLRESSDRVVVHADPPTHAASALVFARTADATLLVARRHQTRRATLAETADGLRQIGARVMGVVLNERRAYEGLTIRSASQKTAPVGTDSALARAVAAAASLASQSPPRSSEQVYEPPVRPAPTPIALSWTCRCGRENPGAFPHCPRCGRSQPDEAQPRTG